MNLYKPAFESLTAYECPKWYRDAKFGIWSHWGPQSVPMCGDWYARYMYIEGSTQYRHHLRQYGHPSKFGYKDICRLWQAEKFDPAGLMSLYKKAGARFFVAQAMHHDHFFNYPSQYNRFNSVNVGPGKDICGLWKEAADREGLPFGLSEHLGASYTWWKVNKGADTAGPYAGVPYDGNDPAYRDFYFDHSQHMENKPARPGALIWYTSNKKFHEYWLSVMKELIDCFRPDLLYTDGCLPFGERNVSLPGDPVFTCGLEAVAYLYNTSVRLHGENRAVYTQKDKRSEIYRVGVLDIERSQLPDISPDPWQTDTCIGGWFYDLRQAYKKPGHIIEILVDVVAKNGCLLLNILQRPDGSIDDETAWILEELAGWFAICGKAIYATRPWRVLGEGESRVVIDQFKEDKVAWTSSDFRFTAKGDTIYAFMMQAPENRVAVIKSLTEEEKVVAVKLLGAGECQFEQSFGVLTVRLPEKLPTPYINCLAIKLARP
ncbi:MAG TPA: alpha-L-fucosidase [Firmicutes bacterium]|nr:alpha-L-fucosidase [Bacillota bacterium]